MKLAHGLHLAYCTNIHRGESWADILAGLERHTLAVRRRVCPDQPYAIGLRLGEAAAHDLSDRSRLREFKAWLDRNHCYVFTINGFPYGRFHGTRVKEQVYLPDWTSQDRLEYTRRLFTILAELLPPGLEGSVSTVPVSFKAFRLSDRQLRAARENLWRMVDHLEQLSRQSQHDLHLGLEPEPLCTLENTWETVAFFEQMRADRPGDLRLDAHLGVNYDCCHLAIQYENPQEAINRLLRARVRISKIHLSNALSVRPTAESRQALRAFADDTYFHQTLEKRPDGEIVRYGDLDEALATPLTDGSQFDREWRIHFHIPLHAGPSGHFQTTADHVTGILDELKRRPSMCRHLEMETYTWEVMPEPLKQRNVVDQLAAEYAWTLRELAQRGL